MKKLFIPALFLLFSQLFAQGLKIALPADESSVPFAYAIEDCEAFSAAPCEYEIYDDRSVMLSSLLKGESDLALLNTEDAAKVYSMTHGKIKVLALVQNARPCIISTAGRLSSVRDLKGKKILCSGHDATDEKVLRFILDKNEIFVASNPVSADLDFSVPASQVVSQLLAAEAEYALMSESFAASALRKSSSLSIALDLKDDYSALTEQNIPRMLLVVNTASMNQKTDIIEKYLEFYSGELKKAYENPARLSVLCKKYLSGFSPAVISELILHGSFVCIRASEAEKQIDGYLKACSPFSFPAESDVLPDDGFYY